MPDIQPDSAETRGLIERIERGDGPALEELLQRHRKPLHSFVELHLDPRLHARVDRSDVVQDTQLYVVQRMDDFLARKPMPFRLRLRDHTRARRSVEREVAIPEPSSLLMAGPLLAGGKSPSQEASARETAQRVSRAVGRLAEADREVLLMRHAEELPYDEIACLLDLEPAAVRKRYGRPLIRLQRALRIEGLLVWVTDFGLAQVDIEAHLTLTSDLMGTLRSMSPEQALPPRDPPERFATPCRTPRQEQAKIEVRRTNNPNNAPLRRSLPMSLSGQLASIGLHSLAVASDLVGCEAAGKLGLAVCRFLGDRVGDGSRQLSDALGQANQRAWSALEAALAGESLRGRLVAIVGRTEDRVFASQLQTFLATVPLGDAHDSEEAARRKAVAELRHARKAGVIAPCLEAAAIQSAAEPLARYTRREEMIDAQEASLRALASAMQQAGYVYLARVLVVRPDGGEPLLVVAMGYFFRRAVEGDEALFRGLSLARMKQLQASVESGFAALELALDMHAARVEEMLGDIHETLAETHEGVLDLRERMTTQGEQLRTIGEAVQQMLEQHRLHRREIRPGDSLTLRDEGERVAVRQLVRRYHALPEPDRARSPALLNAIGKLEVIAGDFGDARRDFCAVADLVEDRGSRAEAHFNAYRAALEKRDNEAAMHSLTAAIAGDARRFSPVPLETYEPERILGAGGFGVAILCRHRYMKANVVVKALWLDPLGVAADHVFSEARLLHQIDHPGIIRITDCGYVDPAAKERPYLVMEYFEGETLEQYLRTTKTLSSADYLVVARQVAEGLLAAHEQGILHRDVKPANLLVRRIGERRQVKLIDFGLAMRHHPVDDRTTTRAANTLVGQSIAGTLSYAAPEQLRGEAVGPTADIYAFARTSCQLLFGTTHPLPRHWQSIPPSLAALLGQCLEEDPGNRPPDFATVLALMGPTTKPPPAILDAEPVFAPTSVPEAVETFDVEAYTSLLELARLTRRELRLGLFEIAGAQSFPFVARSEAGGYETIRPGLANSEKIHPVLEMRRLILEQNRQGRVLDARLMGQLTEMTTQARTRLAMTPTSLMTMGYLALAAFAVCPFFGFLISMSRMGSAPFVMSTIFTAATGLATVVLGILSIVTLAQHVQLKRFGREIIQTIEPLTPGTPVPLPPVVTWPGEQSWNRLKRLILAVALIVTASLAGIFLASLRR